MTVKNSRGNELVEMFNFAASDDTKICDLKCILNKVCKPSYSVDVIPRWRHVVKHHPMSFEELCMNLINFRFYEVDKKDKYETQIKWVEDFRIHTGVPFDIVSWIGDQYDFSFFQVNPTLDSVQFSFEYFYKKFLKHDMILYPSKNPNIWYLKRPLVLKTDEENSGDLVVLKKEYTTKHVCAITKKEL